MMAREKRQARTEEMRSRGAELREWRNRHGLTLEHMASQIGISWTTLQRWETGQYRAESFRAERLQRFQAEIDARQQTA